MRRAHVVQAWIGNREQQRHRAEVKRKSVSTSKQYFTIPKKDKGNEAVYDLKRPRAEPALLEQRCRGNRI